MSYTYKIIIPNTIIALFIFILQEFNNFPYYVYYGLFISLTTFFAFYLYYDKQESN